MAAVHLLEPDSVTFQNICDQFQTSWVKGKCPNVDRIFEIDNAKLKSSWDSFKQSMGSPDTVEPYYYGKTLQCDLASTKRLCKNAGCYICQTSQGEFGVNSSSGFHFLLAQNSSKSDEYTHRSYNCRTMLLFYVLPGKKYTVSASQTRLTAPPAGYDSVYLTPGRNPNDQLIVLYKKASILPRYIIIYGKYTKGQPS